LLGRRGGAGECGRLKLERLADGEKRGVGGRGEVVAEEEGGIRGIFLRPRNLIMGVRSARAAACRTALVNMRGGRVCRVQPGLASNYRASSSL
jgi:hypothetical protein